MELHKLSEAKLTHLEAGQLIKTNIKDLITAGINTDTDPHVKTYVGKMSSDTILFDKGLLQISKKAETEELASIDRVRDFSLGAFNKQLVVFEHTRNADKLVAYKSLEIVAEKYKGLAYLNYEAESNGIDNLLAELTNATHAPHIATLNMSEFVDDIHQTNEEFKLKFSQRSADISSTEIFNMKLIRKSTFENYKNYIEYVLSLSKVNPNDDYYKSILNVINQSRKYYSDLLAKRNGGKNPPTNGATN